MRPRGRRSHCICYARTPFPSQKFSLFRSRALPPLVLTGVHAEKTLVPVTSPEPSNGIESVDLFTF